MTWKKYISEIGDAPLPKKQLNHIFKSFDKLHKSGILHGDIHDENIVLADDNLPRIIDFGSAIYDSPQELLTTEGKLIQEIKPTFDRELMKGNPKIKKLRMNNRILRYKILTTQRGN
jgi:serine/threonine protein kinase